MTDPLHPIGPRDRDIEPVQRLMRLARDGGRERQGAEHEQAPEEQRERHPEQGPKQPPPPESDDGNPHVDVRV